MGREESKEYLGNCHGASLESCHQVICTYLWKSSYWAPSSSGVVCFCGELEKMWFVPIEIFPLSSYIFWERFF